MSSFFPHVPFVSSLHSRVLECVVFVHVHSRFCEKLDSRAIKCIFIYCKTTRVPVEQNHRIRNGEGSFIVDKGQYQRLVGKLI